MPLIVFLSAPEFIPGQNIALSITLALVGTMGTSLGLKRIVALVSGGLLTVLILGKIAADISRLPAPDSAVFIIEFMAIIFLMEASNVVITFDVANRNIGSKEDEPSRLIRKHLAGWVRSQLRDQTKLAMAALGLSLGLIIVGGSASVSVNQLYFSAVLVLLSVGMILFLAIHGREPETKAGR